MNSNPLGMVEGDYPDLGLPVGGYGDGRFAPNGRAYTTFANDGAKREGERVEACETPEAALNRLGYAIKAHVDTCAHLFNKPCVYWRQAPVVEALSKGGYVAFARLCLGEMQDA